MSNADDPIELDDASGEDDSEDASEPRVEVAKTNLAKRRLIDNLLDEKRLRKQLSDYDFDD